MTKTKSRVIKTGDLANDSQREAIDPHVSAWVSASAGTGKTKVLTERVLSLLLSGCAPQKILCLTFTKAAAAEMESRIFQYLGEWVILDDQELRNRLSQILGKPPESNHMARARRLFAQVLETPGASIWEVALVGENNPRIFSHYRVIMMEFYTKVLHFV